MTKITIDAAVVQQAIDAFECAHIIGGQSDCERVCAVFRAAIEQAEGQEPLFWYRPVSNGEMYEGPVHNNSVGGNMLREEKPGEWKPLYTHPAPAQPVQEPTVPKNSQDWKGMDGSIAFHLIERHADNWNDISLMMGEWLAANQAQPEGFSPCDMATAAALGFRDGVESVRPAKPLGDAELLAAFGSAETIIDGLHEVAKLAAQPAKPLSDDDISDIWDGWLIHITDKISAIQFARAIEQAHGIKGAA